MANICSNYREIRHIECKHRRSVLVRWRLVDEWRLVFFANGVGGGGQPIILRSNLIGSHGICHYTKARAKLLDK